MDDKLLRKISEGRQYRKAVEHFRTKETSEKDKMIVEGHATTFGQAYTLYDDGEYRIDEQIDAGAFDECDMSDVIFQYNHEGRVFARNRNKTLEISTDESGLKVWADLSGTEEGRKLYQEIEGGYTDRMSFGFTVAEDKVEKIVDRENHKITILRTITKVGKLYDVSAVSIPANDGTDISARSYSDGVIEMLKAERQEERAKNETEKAKAMAMLSL